MNHFSLPIFRTTQKRGILIASIFNNAIHKYSNSAETTTIKQPADWFLQSLGIKTNSGVTTTNRTSLTLSAFYGGVNIIANHIALLPIAVVIRDANIYNSKGSITYQWSIQWEGTTTWINLGTNSGETVNVDDNTDFILRVHVTDGDSDDSDLHGVTVELECAPSNPCGF